MKWKSISSSSITPWTHLRWYLSFVKSDIHKPVHANHLPYTVFQIFHERINTYIGWNIFLVSIFFSYFLVQWSFHLHEVKYCFFFFNLHFCSRWFGMITANAVCSTIYQPLCINYFQTSGINSIIYYKIFVFRSPKWEFHVRFMRIWRETQISIASSKYCRIYTITITVAIANGRPASTTCLVCNVTPGRHCGIW